MVQYDVVASCAVEFNANCLVCLQHDDADAALIACGLYTFNFNGDTSVNARRGGLQLLEFRYNQLSPADFIETSGVFDFVELVFNDQQYIVSAQSDGCIMYFHLASRGRLKVVQSNPVCNAILTCIDGVCRANLEAMLICGNDLGSVELLSWTNSGVTTERSWKDAHALRVGNAKAEVWVVKFDTRLSARNLAYSGGDDGVVKIWDIRTDKAAMTLADLHSAGVLDINVGSPDDNVVLTGSYDDSVKFWDCRNWSQPLASLSVGGGAWKLQWQTSEAQNLVLVACMYNGWCVIDSDANVISHACSEFGENIVYGVDFISRASDKMVVATSSFYDSSVRIYEVTNAF